MSNKGLKLIFCPQCNRKRYCQNIPIPNFNFKKICSKGHEWIIKGLTLERINAAAKSMINSEKLKNLFDRDGTFFRAISKK
jgi:hypothetical protein